MYGSKMLIFQNVNVHTFFYHPDHRNSFYEVNLAAVDLVFPTLQVPLLIDIAALLVVAVEFNDQVCCQN